MTCREVADFIMDYWAGELSGPTREIFERHLSRCANCREYLAQYCTTIALGRRAFAVDRAAAVTAGVPEDLVAAILAARPPAPADGCTT